MTLKTRQIVHCQRDGTPNCKFRGTPLKKWDIYQQILIYTLQNGCDLTSFSPKNGPIRLIYHKNGMSVVMCYVLYFFRLSYSCAFPHIYYINLHKYCVISQILNAWSIYLHLGSLGVNVSRYIHQPQWTFGEVNLICLCASYVMQAKWKKFWKTHSPASTIDIRHEDLLSLCGLFGCITDTLLYQWNYT